MRMSEKEVAGTALMFSFVLVRKIGAVACYKYMRDEIATKSVIGLVFTVLGYLYSSLTELMIVFAILMAIDYVTGTLAGLLNNGFSRQVAMHGIAKKIGYICLLLLSVLMDFSICYVLDKSFGFRYTAPIFGFAITCYLIGTEGLSIIQNLIKIGVPVPDSLKIAFGMLKDFGQHDEKEKKDGQP